MLNDNLFFRKLIEYCQEGISLMNKEYVIIYRSPSSQKISGYKTVETNNEVQQLVHPEDAEAVSEVLKAVHKSPHSSKTYSFRLKHADGHYIWLKCTYTNMFHDPDINAIICNFIDITAQKASEELFNNVNSLARIGGWEVNLLENSVYWSDITREIHETDRDYVPNLKSVIDFYKKGKNSRRIVAKLKEVIKNDTIWDEELEIITAKGNSKWVRIIAEAEFQDGRCIRIHGSLQDIDTLKKTEIRAKEVLEERNTILESIADAFFAVDKNWTVTYWNNSAEKVLHKTKEEVLHHNLWDVFSDSIGSESYNKYHEAINLNQAMHFEDHYTKLHKWYEISAYPSNAGLSVYFKDITERKLSELLLNNLNVSLHQQAKELSDSNAELEQFAYVASHDLQEPLRMVTSFLTQLELKYHDVIDDRGKKYIHFAVDGAKRMRQIILDLLEYSRVGRFEAQAEEVQINEIIADILILFRKEIDEQGAMVTFTNMPTVNSYKVPIRQLFQNLISNALKYKDPNRKMKISITAVETRKHYQFAIADTGIGIAKEYYEKIFIIFQRLHNKDEYSGTGLGLAIAKKLVENLGGKIWLESTPKEGTTFYFTIEKTQSK
jgi:PAS domain S-box-containing protein